jgi:thymidine kinase
MSLYGILGPMFSGKSSQLLYYIRKYRLLGYSSAVIKPDNDNRYTDKNEICSHNFDKEPCCVVPINGLLSFVTSETFMTSKVILIEEGQFFKDLYEFIVDHCFPLHKIVYVAALNGDSNRQLFGEIYKLLPLFTKIEWMEALCMICKDGTPACYSKRKTEDTDQVVVGSSNHYEAVCFKHY